MTTHFNRCERSDDCYRARDRVRAKGATLKLELVSETPRWPTMALSAVICYTNIVPELSGPWEADSAAHVLSN